MTLTGAVRESGVRESSLADLYTVVPDDSARISRISDAGQGMRNAITVDVEDYFQVSAFDAYIDRGDWNNFPSRVEANTERILSLFAEHQVSGTFFVLGWIAERYPALVRRIVESGHELGSHGYGHVRIYQQKPQEFRDDVMRTKRLLEDISGIEVRGYRAASFSIRHDTLWAVDILRDVGHIYSSSVYPVHHDLYGMPEASRFPFQHETSGLLEIPITTVKALGQNLPIGGGGYFRIYPYGFFRRALRRVNINEGQPGVFYFHPWEIDPEQPRQQKLGPTARFRHYVNLDKTEKRLRNLLADFRWGRVDEVFL